MIVTSSPDAARISLCAYNHKPHTLHDRSAVHSIQLSSFPIRVYIVLILEEASYHESAKTHAGNDFVTRDLNF